MAVDIVIVGGGEHAHVVAEALRSAPGRYRLLGFTDVGQGAETVARLGLSRLGNDGWLERHGDVALALGIGDLPGRARRRQIIESFGFALERWVPVVHSQAWVSPTARLESGAQILAGAIVQSGAVVGTHVLVNTGAIVEHDVGLGPYVSIGPGAILGGGVEIGADSFVGMGALVRDHVRIGQRSVVAMGAVVVADAASEVLLKGVPARVESRP